MDPRLIPNTCQVPNVVLDKIVPKLPNGAVRVLLAVIRYTYGWQKPEGDRISYDQLSHKTGLSRRQVIRSVQDLGALLRIRRGSKSRGSNYYSFNLDVGLEYFDAGSIGDTHVTTKNVIGDTHVTNNGHLLVTPMSPSETHKDKPKDARCGGKTTDTPTNGSNPRSYPTRKGIEQRLAAFAVFRAAYPRKVAMAKAEAAWEKINPDESLVSTILASLDVQRKSENWTKENGRFIPYPATWLNQRRWEDEINGDPDDDVPPPRRVLAIVEDMGGNKIKLEDGTTMRKDLYEQRFGVKPGVGMGNAGAGAHPVDEILRARGEWES